MIGAVESGGARQHASVSAVGEAVLRAVGGRRLRHEDASSREARASARPPDRDGDGRSNRTAAIDSGTATERCPRDRGGAMKALLLGAALLLPRPSLASGAAAGHGLLRRPHVRRAARCHSRRCQKRHHRRRRQLTTAAIAWSSAGRRTSRPTPSIALRARLGNTFVAPVIPYAPGGVIPLRDEAFAELLEAAATSAKRQRVQEHLPAR